MSIRSIPRSLSRAILSPDALSAHFIIPSLPASSSPHIPPLYRQYPQLPGEPSCGGYRQDHRHHERRRAARPSLLLGTSALGIAFVGDRPAGEAEHRTPGEQPDTNFDTIRPVHSRQSSSRPALPFLFDSSTTCSSSFDLHRVWPQHTSGEKSRRPHQKSISSNSSPLGNRVEGRKTLRRARSSHPIGQSNFGSYQPTNESCLAFPPPPPSLPSTLLTRSPFCPASSSLSFSTPIEDVDESTRFTSPNYDHVRHQHPTKRSTNFSTPLRNCRSLQFAKQIQRGSRHPPHYNPIDPRSITPSTSPCPTDKINIDIQNNNPFNINTIPHTSHRPAAVSSDSSSSQRPSSSLPAPHSSCTPEPLPFPTQSLVCSPPTKLSGFVKSKIQRTARTSTFHTRTSSSLSFYPQRVIPPPPVSTDTANIPASSSPCPSPGLPSSDHGYQPVKQLRSSTTHNSVRRSLSFSATHRLSKAFPVTPTPPMSMNETDHDVEALLDYRSSQTGSPPSLRSLPPQHLTAEHQQRRVNGLRSQSILADSLIHRRSRSSSIVSQTLYPLPRSVSGLPPAQTQRSGKPSLSSITRHSSPPRNSVRTHLTRLAHLLTPSPNIKYSPGSAASSSKAKIPSPPLQSKPVSISRPTNQQPCEQNFRSGPSTALGVSHANGSSTPAPMEIINWRTTISDQEYRKILEEWGPTEIRRQQLIWELCQTEIAFLDNLTLVSDLFTSPLKYDGPQGTWVAEVPEPIQILFEDLNQITNLHSEIVMGMTYNRLCEKKRNKAPIVIGFATMMAAFVPRLRVYERYLVRFERVSKLIDRLSIDPADNFGSFVRIQSHAAGFGAMTLTSHLLKPIQRLMKYPLFFRQLCDTTPKNHPDYHSTSKLWNATDGIIRSMQDVKGLEDDYEALKGLEEQMLGLPPGFVLANRRRRIVARATFLRVYPSSKDLVKLSLTSVQRLSYASHPSSLSLNSDFLNKPSGKGRMRPLSPVSDSSEISECTQSQASVHSIITESSLDLSASPASFAPPVPPPQSSSSACSHYCGPESTSSSHDISLTRFKTPRTLQSKRSSHKLMKGRSGTSDLVEVILLSDLLVLCTRETHPKKNWRSSSKKFEEFNRFRVLIAIGLSRVVYVEDVGGKLPEFDELVRLDLVPLEEVNQIVIDKKKSATTNSSNNENKHPDNNVIYLSSCNPSLSASGGQNKKSTQISGSMSSGGMSTSGSVSQHHTSLPGLGVSAPSSSHSSSLEKDWKNWIKEFKNLESLTMANLHPHSSSNPHALSRQVTDHQRQEHKKRRRSNNGKLDFSIKKASSMQTLL